MDGAGLVEWLRAWDLLMTAVIVPIFGIIVFALRWWAGRMQASADHRVEVVERKLSTQSGRIRDRLNVVERDVAVLKGQVKTIEGLMPGLASTKDVHELKVELTQVSTKLDAVAGQMRTMYQAAMRASEGG
ncbi:MAG: hypothetical protein ACU0CI_03535 [Shimia sp.]